MKSKYCLISLAHEFDENKYTYRTIIYEGSASEWLIQALEKGLDVILLHSEPITHHQYKKLVNIIKSRKATSDLSTAYQQDANKNIN